MTKKGFKIVTESEHFIYFVTEEDKIADLRYKLARKDARIKYKRRQTLYSLRDLEKKGKALEKAGITMEILEKMDKDDDE